MIKRETFELLSQIAAFYDQFVVNQEKLDTWHEVLKSYTVDEIKENLSAYVKESSYPPKLSEIVTKLTTIPNPEETKLLTTKCEPAEESKVQKELAAMRKILGMTRG